MRQHLLKIGVSGIRGVVGEFLTPALATAFAHAFGTYIGRGLVVVGRDTRRSGPMLQHAVHCGLLAAGCDVLDIGIAPTPTLQIFIAHSRARGGLSLTASHNPQEYNALKLFNGEGLFFNHYERAELLDIYHQGEFYRARNQEIGNVQQDYVSAPQLHLERVLRQVDVEAIRARRFRVALDGVNGAGARMSCELLGNRLNCELTAIHVDPEQAFPRNPEPKPETLHELADLVRRSRADIGFAQDPDGDRLGVADETGEILDNDDVLALVVDAVLERVAGDVVVNLTTSQVIDDVARRHGRKVWRTPVGEANVIETMKAVPTAIGGEGSNGGIIFPAVHLCRDSYTGMSFLLNRLAATGLPVSELRARLPRFVRRAGSMSYGRGSLPALLRQLEAEFPDAVADRSDGLKLSWPDCWVHVRSSNTEPVLRIATEARESDTAQQLYDRVVRLVKQLGSLSV